MRKRLWTNSRVWAVNCLIVLLSLRKALDRGREEQAARAENRAACAQQHSIGDSTQSHAVQHTHYVHSTHPHPSTHFKTTSPYPCYRMRSTFKSYASQPRGSCRGLSLIMHFFQSSFQIALSHFETALKPSSSRDQFQLIATSPDRTVMPSRAAQAGPSAVVERSTRGNASAAHLTPYELEREERIRQQQELFRSLGLDKAPPLLAKKPPPPSNSQKKRASRGGTRASGNQQQRQQPMRHSKRQRGEAPEHQLLTNFDLDVRDFPESPRSRQQRVSKSGYKATVASRRADDGDVQAHDNLNTYRCACLCCMGL